MESRQVSNPRFLKQLLEQHGFSFKKQFGQNFLIDAHVLEKIVEAAELTRQDGAFEVGPGAGVVTKMLSERAHTVVTVEKDTSLAPILRDTLQGSSNVHVEFADVLDIDLSSLWERFADCEKVSVIANLPYYVTTPILFHLLESPIRIHNIVVMVQKEVADRLLAPPGGKDYGALTVAVQYRAKVSKVTVVKPHSFMPPPSVDSTVVRMTCYETAPVDVADEPMFTKVVRAAFGVRRKTLLNALSTGLPYSKDHLKEVLVHARIEESRRGETLTIEEFARISNALSNK